MLPTMSGTASTYIHGGANLLVDNELKNDSDSTAVHLFLQTFRMQGTNFDCDRPVTINGCSSVEPNRRNIRRMLRVQRDG